jgi:hypothetical protein
MGGYEGPAVYGGPGLAGAFKVRAEGHVWLVCGCWGGLLHREAMVCVMHATVALKAAEIFKDQHPTSQ